MYAPKIVRGRLLWLTALLCTLALPSFSRADDEKGTEDKTAKPAPVKVDAPAPGLSELESRLLDRVAQLEKRLAELESKGMPAAPAAAETQPAQPAKAAVGGTDVAAPVVD